MVVAASITPANTHAVAASTALRIACVSKSAEGPKWVTVNHAGANPSTPAGNGGQQAGSEREAMRRVLAAHRQRRRSSRRRSRPSSTVLRDQHAWMLSRLATLTGANDRATV